MKQLLLDAVVVQVSRLVRGRHHRAASSPELNIDSAEYSESPPSDSDDSSVHWNHLRIGFCVPLCQAARELAA